MRVSLDIKQVAIMLVLIALFILIVFLIRLAFKLIDTLRRVDDLLADTKRMTTIAAARTEQVDEQIDRAIEMFTNVGDKINENRSIIKTAGNVGTAAGALRSFRKKSKKRANRYETSGMDYERPNRIRRRRFR
ncbi:DUF948 domain-containing protein [Mogibacterium timidum]|uniref:PF06103 family protein n=3 Tax=Anaerovoracaceae TaxID=543314 RepID=X8IWE9_9FIRM|nr:DUF948 domain-containing protein [Mogibacterium timidum]EUC53361.1 hypothetical protein HMPREF0581_0799 [Mogibacterium timidum ATCC 33093]NWO23547.1 hypothetical protein [Mogibacterium timidum]